MIMLWAWIVLITVFALAVLIMPLLRPKTVVPLDLDKLNAKVYQERIHTLKSQLAQGELTAEEYQQLVIDAKKALLIDVRPRQQKTQLIKSPSFALSALIIILIPLTSIYLYNRWGSADKLLQKQLVERQAPIVKAELVKLGSPEKIIAKLAETVKQHPTHPKGWFLLGKLYLSQGQYGPASNALAKANALAPKQIDIMNAYAESLFFLNDRHLTPTIHHLLDTILRQDPNNITAINLRAIGAYRVQDYQGAINAWEHILSLVPANSKDSETVIGLIARARTEMKTHS